MGRTLAALSLALLCLVPSVGAAGEVHGVWRDLFHPVAVEAMTFEGGCGVDGVGNTEGSFEVNATQRMFRFEEQSFEALGGQFQTACGTASMDFAVPAGTDHVHVRFNADRELGDVSGGNIEPNAHQRVVASSDGYTFYSVAYYQPTDASQAMTHFDLPTIALPAGATSLRLGWTFADDGAGLQQGVINVASPHGFSATVMAPELEFSGVPLTHDMRSSTTNRGDQARTTTSVTVPIGTYESTRGDGHMRVRYDDAWHLESMQLPNGTVLRDFDPTPSAEHMRSDHVGLPQLEHNRAGRWRQVQLPATLVSDAGEGEYTFNLVHVERLEPVAGMTMLGLLVLSLPLVLAAVAYRGIRAFCREAFGNFERGAKSLLLALWLMVAFYAAVVLASWRTGALLELSLHPTSGSAGLVYLQVGIAMAAFAGLAMVGQRLRAITRPARA